MADEAIIPDELRIAFRKAVKLGEESYTEMALREPTAAQWEAWDKLDGVEMDITAVATVSGLPVPVIRMLGVRDLNAAARYIARFLA